jgi:hypothetical protein
MLSGVAADMSFSPTLDALADHEAESLDLLLVIGELDSRDELPLLLRVARSRLATGGLIAGAIPGGNSLPALRSALHAADASSGTGFAARVHPRVEAGAFAGLLGDAGFAEPVVDIDRVRLRYRSFGKLVADLRDHGATNVLRARPRTPLGRSQLVAAEQAFAARVAEGATDEQIELLFFAGWAGQSDNRP